MSCGHLVASVVASNEINRGAQMRQLGGRFEFVVL